MALTTTANIPSAVSEFYNRQLLERTPPELVFDMFGQIRPLPTGNSKISKFRRYESLSTSITPLSEGIPPSSMDPTKTDITATIKTYGAWLEYTDDLILTQPDPEIADLNEILSEQAAESIDIIRRDTLGAGTAVSYTNGSSRNAVTSTMDLATLRKVLRTLRNNKAKYIREIVRAGVKTATVPIPRSYVCVIHPDVAHDVKQLTGFKGIEEYGSEQTIHESEIGAIPSIQMRFLETTQAKIVSGGGGSSSSVKNTGGVADVYISLVFARNAYGIIPLSGNAMKSILKPLGWDDPMEMAGSIAWKAKTTQVILNDNFMHRIESAAST